VDARPSCASCVGYNENDVTADLSPLEFLGNMSAALEDGIVDLPAFPQVVIQVQEAFKNPNYTPQTIAKVVLTERPLADRLLQLANSTAFNATGKVIIDLGVAINRLGAQKVYSVALAHAIQHIRRDPSLRAIAGKLDELWSECVITAHFSQAVTKLKGFTFPGAFAAGLLHGIGRFYILSQAAKQAATRGEVPLNDSLIDAWHPAIAEAVLKNWQVDPAVSKAVGEQAQVHVVRAGPATLTDVLVAALRLANRLQNRYDTANFNAGGAFARLDLTVDACQGLIADADADIKMLQRALRS
jgi:HD-like signal output (HDOD) protein